MSELRLNTDGHIIKFGADNDVSLTHVADTGLLLNSTMQLQFNDATQFVQGSSATVLSIGATDEIDLTATEVEINVTTLDVNGAVALNGAVTGATNITLSGELDAATLDISGAIDIAGASVLHGLLTHDGGAVFNEASADVDFRVESNGSSAMLFVDGGNNRVGVGTNSPSVELHVDQAAGEITEIRASAATIHTKLIADDASGFNELDFSTTLLVKEAGTEVMRIIAGEISTGAEAAPDVSAGGLCLDQNALDTHLMTFKSSDVAHGATANAEADTFGIVMKASATNGGVLFKGYSEDNAKVFLYHATATGAYDTTKSTSAECLYEYRTFIVDSGASGDNITGNGNLFGIYGGNLCHFVFDTEGDFHADSSSTTFDAYDDAQLARTIDLSRGKDTIDSKFDKFIAYNHEHLAELKLVGREDDGTPNNFINVTGLQRLHNGAIWQQYEKHERLLEAVYDLAKEAVGEDKADAILDKHEIKRLQ